MERKKVSIVIPVYNEKNFFEKLLEKVEGANFCGLEKEIIIVNDASNDGTGEILEKFKEKYKVYHHEKNMGKGAALRTGFSYATGDIIVIQDADLEYSPEDYENLLPMIIDDMADVVYGSRLIGDKNRKAFSALHLFGNKMLTLITNVLYGTKLTDMETCYKAFKAEVLKNITVRSDRFDFEPEITAKVLKQKCRLKEVPIAYLGRDFAEGKKITWKDGFGAILALVKYRFSD